MPIFTDQTGKKVFVEEYPKRIVSLVPSQTELLFDLGLRDEVAGITKFCIHPAEWFRTKTRVGGTKQLKQDIIRRLNPDLILANKEENSKEQVEELQKHFPVWISDVNSLADAYSMIESVGKMNGKVSTSQQLIADIRSGFSGMQLSNKTLRAAFLIWQKPYMTAGGDTFIHSMMEAAGLENIFKTKSRYPETSIKELAELNCELLLLSSEPFPFKQKHSDEIQPLLPSVKIILADGEMFSWYGSRLLQVPSYFVKLRQEISL